MERSQGGPLYGRWENDYGRAFLRPANENTDKDFETFQSHACHGIEVEVDERASKILKYCGPRCRKAINPMLLEGQVYGGAAMGVGYA
jgi:CO/xanthine dehydrogenase Mo-binding subunit